MSEIGIVSSKYLELTLVGYRHGKPRDAEALDSTIESIIGAVVSLPGFRKYYGQFLLDMKENAKFRVIKSLTNYIDENLNPFSYIYTTIFNSFVQDINYRRTHQLHSLDNEEWEDLLKFGIEPKPYRQPRYCELSKKDFDRCESLVDQVEDLLTKKITKPNRKKFHKIFAEFYEIVDGYYSIEGYHRRLRRFIRDDVEDRKFYERAAKEMFKIFYRKIREK
jgi:hypothetical protein